MATPSKKTLSERMLERALDQSSQSNQPGLNRTNRNLAIFRSLKGEIEHALNEGWSMAFTWTTLQNEKAFTGSYSCFRAYVRKFITDKKQNEIAVAVESPPDSKNEPEVQKEHTETPVTFGKKDSRIPKFQHVAIPSKDLI